MNRPTRIQRAGLCFAMLLCLALVSPLSAQNAVITGSVSDGITGEALPGVHIRLLQPTDGSFLTGAYSDGAGSYRINGLAAGSYQLVTSYIGYQTDSRTITVDDGSTKDVSIALEENVLDMEEVVITASRRKEKVLDAPASVAVVTARDIQSRNALTPVDHLQDVQGVDVAQKGVIAREYIARGLNNIFNGSMRTLVDNRQINLPALRANVSYLQSLTDADIDRVEVVLGPGSALYGPNVTNGVVNIITKSPFASRGTDVSLMGGTQSLYGGSARHAGTLGGNFGYRISAGYLSAEDWAYTDPNETYPADRTAERYSMDARMDYMIGGSSTVTLNAGRSTAVRGLDMTDNGAVFADNFSYSHAQGRYVSGDLFVQGYVNMNDAGDTYILRTGQAIVDNSKTYGGEIQYGSTLTDWQRLTYGADMILTRPETDGTIMGRNEANDDVNEFGAYLQSDTRLVRDKVSLLLAGRIDYHSRLKDPVFSPRAGVLYTPSQRHSIRATYNQAYLTPAISDLFLDLLVAENVFDPLPPEIGYGLRNVGVPETGYTFERRNGDLVFFSKFNPDPTMGLGVSQAAAYWSGAVQVVASDPSIPEDYRQLLLGAPTPDFNVVSGVLAQLNLETESFDMISATQVQDIARLEPTALESWELGYKGMLSERLQLTVDVYQSHYENFITPARVSTPNVFLNGEQTAAYLYGYAVPIVGEEAAMQFAEAFAPVLAQVPLGTVTPEQAADRTELLMIPINYGQIDYWGSDIAMRAGLLRNLQVGASYSFINKVYFDDVDGKGPLSLNVPQHKAALSLQYTEPSTGIVGMVRYRFHDGFRLKSGVYEGTIDPYGLVDLGARIPLPLPLRPDFVLSVQNLLDHEHIEYVGGARIGRLITGRLQLHF